MKLNTIKGAIENIAIMKFLKSENFITSSKIREAFPDIKSGTLEQRLRDLANQKLLIKREREYGLAEDKIEYKLSERGLLELKKLITKYPHILKSI